MVVNDKFIHHQSQQRLRYRAASAISTSGCSCSSNRDSCRELPANPMIKSWSFPGSLSLSLSHSFSLSLPLPLSLLLSLLPAFFMPPILCPRFLLSVLSCHPHPFFRASRNPRTCAADKCFKSVIKMKRVCKASLAFLLYTPGEDLSVIPFRTSSIRSSSITTGERENHHETMTIERNKNIKCQNMAL